MAQGGLKTKFSAVPPKGKASKGKKKKPLGPRKGGHYIAPKKGKRIETDRIKKALSKQIDLGIEKSIHQQALTDGTEFRVLENNKPPPPTSKVSKTGPSISGPSKSGSSKSGSSKSGSSKSGSSKRGSSSKSK